MEEEFTKRAGLIRSGHEDPYRPMHLTTAEKENDRGRVSAPTGYDVLIYKPPDEFTPAHYKAAFYPSACSIINPAQDDKHWSLSFPRGPSYSHGAYGFGHFDRPRRRYSRPIQACSCRAHVPLQHLPH
jgi:hypothetical protein